MRIARLFLWPAAAWGVLLTLALAAFGMPEHWPGVRRQHPAPNRAPAPCACRDAGMPAAPAAAAQPAAATAPSATELARYPICAREEAAPELSQLRLANDGPPLWALHCGSSVQLLAIEPDGPLLVPRRLALLRAPSYSPAESGRAVAVSAGDIDGDGRADLIVPALSLDRGGGPAGGGLYLLRQRAQGGFADPVRVLGLSPGAAVAATLDAQPGRDLALLQLRDARTASASELWLLHGGPSPARFAQLPAGVGADALAAADLDRDGLDDLVVTSAREGRARLWLSADGAGFTGAPIVLELPGVREAVAGDLDGDGHADLVLGGERAWLLLARRGFRAQPRAIEGSEGLRDLQLVDADGDGKLDLVGYAHPTVVVLAQGSGLAFERHTLATLQGDLGVLFARVAGLDGDSRPNLVIAAVSSGPDAQVELALGRNLEPGSALRFAVRPSRLRDSPLLQRFTLP